MTTHDDRPLDVLGHFLDDILGKRSGVGRGSDQDGGLDVVDDCEARASDEFQLDHFGLGLTILQVVSLLIGVGSVPVDTLLVRTSVRQLSVSERITHRFDQKTVSINAPAG